MNDPDNDPPTIPTTVLETSAFSASRNAETPEPYLEIVNGLDHGKRFKLTRQCTVFGRSPEADIVLSDPKISRRHGALVIQPDGIVLEDYDSTNGTFVNENRIRKSRLNATSRIRVGSTQMKVDFKITEEAVNEASLYAAANTDCLTQLANRRAFLRRAEQELALCKRNNDLMTIIMSDVDHFKQKNDTYGHPAGDLILKEIAGILKENVRQEDIAARYGGEEFIILLRGTVPELAMSWAERMRSRIESHSFNYDNSCMPTTVSMGVCSREGRQVEDLQWMIKLADDALYKAKQQGRNRVEMA